MVGLNFKKMFSLLKKVNFNKIKINLNKNSKLIVINITEEADSYYNLYMLTTERTVSINVTEFLFSFIGNLEIIKIELINGAFMYNVPRIDQTSTSISECAIEFIVRKRTEQEILAGGRLPQ